MHRVFLNRILIGLLFLTAFNITNQAGIAQEATKHQTDEGINFGLWNKEVPKPAPLIIILSATIDQSLGDPYYRQCGNRLAKEGFLAVSVDLPSHGEFQQKEVPNGLTGWRKSCERKENFVKDAVTRLSKVLDHLIKNRIADPDRIAVCGTSRGGFIALHLAASDPRVNCVVAYAPVTELTALREFKGMEKDPFTKQLSLLNYLNRFQDKKVWLMIGDRDDRVGTDYSIQFMRGITKTSLAHGKNSFAELHVMPEPKGHTTPQGAPGVSANWMLSHLKKEK